MQAAQAELGQPVDWYRLDRNSGEDRRQGGRDCREEMTRMGDLAADRARRRRLGPGRLADEDWASMMTGDRLTERIRGCEVKVSLRDARLPGKAEQDREHERQPATSDRCGRLLCDLRANGPIWSTPDVRSRIRARGKVGLRVNVARSMRRLRACADRGYGVPFPWSTRTGGVYHPKWDVFATSGKKATMYRRPSVGSIRLAEVYLSPVA